MKIEQGYSEETGHHWCTICVGISAVRATMRSPIAAIMQAVMDYQAAGRLSDADYVQISRLIVSLA